MEAKGKIKSDKAPPRDAWSPYAGLALGFIIIALLYVVTTYPNEISFVDGRPYYFGTGSIYHFSIPGSIAILLLIAMLWLSAYIMSRRLWQDLCLTVIVVFFASFLINPP